MYLLPLVFVLVLGPCLANVPCIRTNRTGAGACSDSDKRSGPPSTPQVQFSPLPPAGTTLDTRGSDFNPYLHIKSFLRFVQPRPLPVETLQDYVKGNASLADLISKVLEMEAGFLTLVFLAVILSLAVPVMTFGLCTPKPSPPPSCAPNCKRRTLVFILHLVLFLLLLGGGGMLWTNHECSRGISEGSHSLTRAVQDGAGLWAAILGQLQHLLTRSFEEVLFPMTEDINNAETLLGRPIQVELVLDTGLDNALENLKIIAAGAKEVCSQVSNLMRESSDAETSAVSARTALDDLRKQLDSVRHHCKPQDRPLCDSIIFQNISIRFSSAPVSNSTQLKYLKQGGIDSLANSIVEANNIFSSLPEEVAKQTKTVRQSILEHLSEQRSNLQSAALALNKAKRTVQSDLGDISERIGPAFEIIQYLDYWRWLTGLVAGISVLYIWALLTGATCCGCCGAEKSSSPTLIVTVILIALISFFLWIFMMTIFILGGHAEVYVCQAFEEEPDLSTFSKILDTKGFLMETEGSYLSALLLGNGNISMPLGKIVQKCQKNGSAYGALKLNHLLDVEEVTNISMWNSVVDEINSVHVNLKKLQILTPNLQSRMTELMQGLTVNISSYRSQISGPVSNDLEAFANQLSSVASQINDLGTATHLDTLASRCKRMVSTYIKDLELHKENMVYQLTALELKVNPLQRQVNQSLSHMKAVQFYINNHGEKMTYEAVNIYIMRLTMYLDQYYQHVQRNLKNIPCKSLSDLYNFINLVVCRYIIDPMNGFWFCTFWCLLIFLIQTPICLKLVDYYGQVLDDVEMSTSHSFVNQNDSGDWTPEQADSNGW